MKGTATVFREADEWVCKASFRRRAPKGNHALCLETRTMINGVVISETMQLVCVLLVLFFTIGGIYFMQKFTGV